MPPKLPYWVLFRASYQIARYKQQNIFKTALYIEHFWPENALYIEHF